MRNQKVVGVTTFSCFDEKILPWKGEFGDLREVVSISLPLMILTLDH